MPDIRPILDESHRRPGGYGLILRDWDAKPKGCFAWAEPFPDSLLVPENELDQRLADMAAKRETLLDLRNAHYDTLQSLDQNGYGLCWAFSSTKAAMYLRAIMNEPGLILSAWWVAGKVKGWRDQGGDGSESLGLIAQSGVPEMSLCPGYSSKYDNSACEANAALHKYTQWWEGDQDKQKAWHQFCSACCMGLVSIQDFDWLSHSMCVPVAHKYSSPHSSADNSWGSGGDKGLYDLTGNHALPDGLWIPRVELPSTK